MAMTSASHAEGRQLDPGQVYLIISFNVPGLLVSKQGAACLPEAQPWMAVRDTKANRCDSEGI